MHQGDRGPNAELLSLQDQPHLYGLGAMEGLEGEVTIWDGQVWISRPSEQSRVQTTQTANPTDSATLLVHSTVPQWTQITLTSSLDDSNLRSRVLEHAKAHMQTAIKGSIENETVHIVGFYSRNTKASLHTMTQQCTRIISKSRT